MLYEIDVSNTNVYTVDYFYQQNVCRLCWNTDAVKDLFTKSENGSLDTQLLDKIKYCLDLNITEDSFPKRVCVACCIKIAEFYKFKYFCLKTDKKLKEIINSAFNDVRPSCEVKIELSDNDGNIQKDIQICFIEEIGETDSVKGSKLTTETLKTDYNGFSDCDSNYKPSENEFIRKSETSGTKKRKKKMKNKNIHTRSENLNLEQETQLPKSVMSLVKKKKYKPKRCVSYCNICRTDLGSREKLSIHNSLNHGIEEGNVFKCFGCEKRFKTRKARMAHEINFCKGLKEGYKCGKCDRFLPKRGTYEAHMRDHRKNSTVVLPEKIFQCTKCYLLFKTKICLKEHMAVHDMGKRNYVCETCGRVFKRQDYLQKHKLTHTGTKQHICPHCGYRAAQKSSLTLHIRKHTGERPYSCDFCPQMCISSSNLRAHIRRHVDRKKFECTICNKKFGYKRTLADHIATVHERSQTFSCDQCNGTFSGIRGLRRHRLTKHSKQDKPPADGAEQQKAINPDFFVKITDDEKKNELKEIEVFQMKESEDFVLLNAESGVLITKMY